MSRNNLFDCSIVDRDPSGVGSSKGGETRGRTRDDSIISAIIDRDAFDDRNVAARSLKRIGIWPWRSIHHLYQDHVRLVKLSIVRDAARTDEQIKKRERKKKERKKADDATGTRLFIKGHLRPRFLEAFRCDDRAIASNI